MNAHAERVGWMTPDRVLQGLCLGVLLLSVYGLGLRCEERYKQWLTERKVQSLLQAIHARQVRYREASMLYASTLEALRVRVPEGIQARLYVGRMGDRPGYIAEACAGELCWLVSQNGDLLRRQEITAAPLRIRQEGVDMTPPAVAQSEAANDTVTAERRQNAPEEATLSSGEAGEGRDGEAMGRVAVVPVGDPTAYGLKAGTPLPPLSPTRNTTALWGSLKEVRP